MVDIDTKKEYIDNITIYEFNVDKIMDVCYNEGDETYKFIALLNTDKDKLHEKCKGDKTMAKFEKEIKKLNDDSEFISFMTAEEDAKKTHNTIVSNYYEEGEKNGIEIGAKESKFEIARNLLELNIKIDDISKATGLSVKEIQNLK